MKTKLLLRIAAGLMVFHALGHTRAIATWQNPGSAVPAELIEKMQTIHFSFKGNDSTMAAFYSGNGYAATILLLLIAALLWIVSDWENKAAVKLLWPAALSVILLAVIELIYFFPLAVIISLITAGLVFFSIFKLSKS
jgi:hypothetical protein